MQSSSLWQWYNARTLIELVAFAKLAKRHYLYANTNNITCSGETSNNQTLAHNNINKLVNSNNQTNAATNSDYNYCLNEDTTESNIKRRRLLYEYAGTSAKHVNIHFEILNNIRRCNKSQLLNALFNMYSVDQLEQIKTRYGFLVLYKQQEMDRAKYIGKRLLYIFKQWTLRCRSGQSIYGYVPASSFRTQYLYQYWQSEYVLIATYQTRTISLFNNHHHNNNNHNHNYNYNAHNSNNNTNNNHNNDTKDNDANNTYGYNNYCSNNSSNNNNNNSSHNGSLNTNTSTSPIWDAVQRTTTITLELCPAYAPQGTIIHNTHSWWKSQNKNGKYMYVHIDYSDAVYEYICRNSFNGLQVEAKWIHNCNNLNLVGGVSCKNIQLQANLMLPASVSLQFGHVCGKHTCKTLEFQLLPQYFGQQKYTNDNRLKFNQMFSTGINNIFNCSCGDVHFANAALKEQEEEHQLLGVMVCASIDRSGHILFHHSSSTVASDTTAGIPTFTSHTAERHYHQSFHFNHCQVYRTVILEADIIPFIQQDLECNEWNKFVFTTRIGEVFQYTPIIKIVQEYIGG